MARARAWLAWGGMVLSASLWAAACGDDAGGSGGAGSGGSVVACPEDLVALQQEVFVPNCVRSGCHGGDTPAVGLDLGAADLEARLVNQPATGCDMPLVVPGAPDDSFLMQKLEGPDPTCGSRMPIGAVMDPSFLMQKLEGPDPTCGSRMPIGAVMDPALTRCIGRWIESLSGACETCGGGACVDTASDVAHCGECGLACATGATCEASSCQCVAGQTACTTQCATLESDPSHCGACDNPCQGALVCSLSDCKTSCDPGLTQCGRACVDPNTHPNHCGGCDVDCGLGGTCVAGSCICADGSDVLTDPESCGRCGNVCAPGQTCSGGACVCAAGSGMSFAADVQPILTKLCATSGCHRSPVAKEGMNLSEGQAYAATVGVASKQCSGRLRVDPGRPDESYLIDKMLGVDLCFGGRMPKQTGGDFDAEIATISDWICNGAPDD